MRGEAAGRGLREDGLDAWERIMHVSAEGELPKKATRVQHGREFRGNISKQAAR